MKTLAQKLVEIAGAQWVGIQAGEGLRLALFRDPETETTLALSVDDVTVARVIAKMKAARLLFEARGCV